MTSSAASVYGIKNPFPALHTKNEKLTGPNSEKDTRHHEISLVGSGLTYEAGDALGLRVTNVPATVDELLAALGATGDETVIGADGTEKPFRQSLFAEYQIHIVEKKFLEACATKAPEQCSAFAGLLSAERSADLKAFLTAKNEAPDYVDILRMHPELRFEPQEFLKLLRKLAPRLYSISSSLKAHPDSVHLTVATVAWTAKNGRQRHGVASTFMAERWEGETRAGLFIQAQKHFRMPEDPSTPIIMVGPGTGVAPFRAFLEDREATGARGKNWLIFGEQRAAEDFLYKEQMLRWVETGHLTRLDTAFSRDQSHKIYVQHRLKEAGRQVWEWLQDGAYFYVCGDKERMAGDVHNELIAIASTHGGLAPEAAKAYIEETLMKTEKRYRRDVY